MGNWVHGCGAWGPEKASKQTRLPRMTGAASEEGDDRSAVQEQALVDSQRWRCAAAHAIFLYLFLS